MRTKNKLLFLFLLSAVISGLGFTGTTALFSAKDHDLTSDDYEKYEYMIPMRDGVKLFTSVYVPKDESEKYPFLITRTPYSSGPYGDQKKNSLHHSQQFVNEKFIFVFQDVRGKFMSEGKFVNMRPELNDYSDQTKVDESTDTWDTVDWLIKNVSNNNGKVGLWGISYPGFYAAAATIYAHPAIKAISPQAPIADWFFDDFHHHGAFFLPHSFGFISIFGQPRKGPTKEWGKRFEYPTPDGYEFYLNDMGPLSNANTKYLKDKIPFWNVIIAHPNYDDFWQKRNLLPHLKNIKPAVLIVGGWFDAEDLYGALNIYSSIEKNNPGIHNSIVMGPWRHGGWARSKGDHLGNVFFSNKPDPSKYFQEEIEYPFFMYYLKDKKKAPKAEAIMYETGTNKWREFETWPPEEMQKKKLYLSGDGSLDFSIHQGTRDYREFVSDPDIPVPFTQTITTRMTPEYMTDDQRFASRRTDVLTYQTSILENDVTFAGKLEANLFVSTSKTAADWVVKLIDVYPGDYPDNQYTTKGIRMGNYQQMVRSEVFRGRFRNSYERPEPFIPDKVTEVRFPLQDVLHSFKKGHRIMIQIQSTWFPLVDRNPQNYVDNIFMAKSEDFVKAVHRVYANGKNTSYIVVPVLDE
jgi:putative CocE/NonD family hydrolase